MNEHLKRGAYQPKPVKRVWIPKPGSAEKRPLGIPTVSDRVVQTALRMVIEPIFEREFAPQSYGFRPGRGCKDALRRVEELLQSGHVHVVDVDIKGYFDTIPHDRLMKLVRERIADGRVLGLIEAFLKHRSDGRHEVLAGRKEGTPQGGVISPLLANIYLNPLDWLMAECRVGDGALRRRHGRAVPPTPKTASDALEQLRGWMERSRADTAPGRRPAWWT